MRSAGHFRVSVPHVVLLKRGPKDSVAGGPAVAALEHEKGRVTYTAAEPNWRKDFWLIPCLLSRVARGCST